jgi:hypothetical protein
MGSDRVSFLRTERLLGSDWSHLRRSRSELKSDWIEFWGSGRALTVAPAMTAVAAFAALPLILWHGVFGEIIGSFSINPTYLVVDLGPWLLVGAGVAFMIPVAFSVGLAFDDRFYPRNRRGYFIWGIVLYLLGFVLVAELYNLWKYGQ